MESVEPLCDRCSEPFAGRMAEAEELPIPTASRQLFHRHCFTCSKRKCGRLLSLDHYGVYQNQIFCSDCFAALLSSFVANCHTNVNPNNGDSNGKIMSADQLGTEKEEKPICRQRSYEQQLRTLHLDDDDSMEEEEEEDDRAEAEYQYGKVANGRGKVPSQTILLVTRHRRTTTPFGAIPEADEQQESQPQQQSPTVTNAPPLLPSATTWRILSPRSIGGGCGQLTNKKAAASIPLFRPSNCKRCASRVFEAEKVVAASEIWHKGCFRCLRCARSLEPGKFSDRAGEIYCNSCYAKDFGPKGVGCGQGAGILQMHH